jgi:DNA polymerase III gamma/tau subunit
MSRVVPDGVYMDIDGLAEVDLGNGTNYNPAEALNMYFQTGSIVGRSMTQDGGMNPGKVPIQELATSSGMGKIQSLIQTYEYYLKMIRDVTGLNEARDGTLPDKQSLVGLQKLAAANSNVATRHVLQASLYLTLRTCENISLRIADALMFPMTKQSLMSSISRYNVGTLEELSKLNMHDFGIFLELEPDEEQKQVLEQNIQIALQAGQIDLEDAIDIREVANLKLANQMLKKRRKDKAVRDQQAQQANIQAQAQSNAQLAEQTAMAEANKQQILTEQKMQLEKAKSDFEVQKMEREAQIKQQLMELEFNYNMQLTQAQGQSRKQQEEFKEDRKDERTKIQATQQSELIDQRKNDLLPKNFESAGNDTMGGFGLEQFGPK